MTISWSDFIYVVFADLVHRHSVRKILRHFASVTVEEYETYAAGLEPILSEVIDCNQNVSMKQRFLFEVKMSMMESKEKPDVSA